jgi:hypothetical protein
MDLRLDTGQGLPSPSSPKRLIIPQSAAAPAAQPIKNPDPRMSALTYDNAGFPP